MAKSNGYMEMALLNPPYFMLKETKKDLIARESLLISKLNLQATYHCCLRKRIMTTTLTKASQQRTKWLSWLSSSFCLIAIYTSLFVKEVNVSDKITCIKLQNHSLKSKKCVSQALIILLSNITDIKNKLWETVSNLGRQHVFKNHNCNPS